MQALDISKIKPLQLEIIRLLKLQKTNLEELKNSGLLSSLSIKDAELKIQVLNTEIEKAKKLELLVMVMGAMKAGKSTTINAIVGTDVLPHRSGAMTSLPTVIRHTPNQKTPQLHFAKYREFNKLLEKVKIKLKQGSDGKSFFSSNGDLQKLIQEIESICFKEKYGGQEDIYSFLFYFNDLMRLAKELDIQVDEQLKNSQQLEDFPQIEIEFNSLVGIENILGNFSLLDTPGPNEANANNELRNILERQLQNSSAVLAVFDYTQRNSDAEKEIKDYLSDVKKDHLFIALNKADQEKNNKNIPLAQKEVALNMGIPHDQVIAVSADRVNLINKALLCLEQDKTLPSIEDNPWVDSFANNVLGSGYDENDLIDIEEIRERSIKSLNKSKFPSLISNVVLSCCRNTPKMVFESAFDRLKRNLGETKIVIRYIESLSAKSEKEIEDAIIATKKYIIELKKAENLLNDILVRKKNEVKKNISNAMNKVAGDVASEVDKLIAIQSSNLSKDETISLIEKLKSAINDMNKNKTGFMNHDPSKRKQQLDALLKLISDASSNKFLVCKNHEDAEKMSKNIINSINQGVAPIFSSFDVVVKSIIDKATADVKAEVDKKIKPIVEGVNKSMAELDIAVELNFPVDAFEKILDAKIDGISSAGVSKKNIETHRLELKNSATTWGRFIRTITPESWELGREWVATPNSECVETVDLDRLKSAVGSKISSHFYQLEYYFDDLIRKYVDGGLRSVENQINNNLAKWLDDFNKELNSKSKEKSEQEHQRYVLDKTKNAYFSLKQDIDATQEEMRALIGA